MPARAPVGYANCYPYRDDEYLDLYRNVINDAIRFACHPNPKWNSRDEFGDEVMWIAGGPGSGLTWTLKRIQKELDTQQTRERPPKVILPFFWSFRDSRGREDDWQYNERRFSEDCLRDLYQDYNNRFPESPIFFYPKASVQTQVETLVNSTKEKVRFVMLLDDLDHFQDQQHQYFIDDVILPFRKHAGPNNRSFRVIFGFHETVALGKMNLPHMERSLGAPQELLMMQIRGMPPGRLNGLSGEGIETALKNRIHSYRFANPRINRFLIEAELYHQQGVIAHDCCKLLRHVLANQEYRPGDFDQHDFYNRMVEELMRWLDNGDPIKISDSHWQNWSRIAAGHKVSPVSINRSHFIVRRLGVENGLHDDLIALMRDCLEYKTRCQEMPHE